MAKNFATVRQYICPCCGGLIEVEVQVPQMCPACEVKREGDLVEPVLDCEDPEWQEKHSKPAWVKATSAGSPP